MINRIFRRKLFVAILLCSFLTSNVFVTDRVAPAYAKKLEQDNIVNEKSNNNDTSKQELVQLILSLKKTMESLDSRLANIESKLDNIDVITSKEDQSRISSKWRDFSAKQQNADKANETPEQDPAENIAKDNNIAVDTVNEDKTQPKIELKSDNEVNNEQAQQENKLVQKNINEESIDVESTPEEKIQPENVIKQEIVVNENDSKQENQVISAKEDKVFLESQTAIDSKEENKKLASIAKVQETKVVEKVATKEPVKNVSKQPAKKIAKIETKKVVAKDSTPKKVVKTFKYNISAENEKVDGNDIGSVSIGGMKVIVYRSEAAGIDSYGRAQIVAKRIEGYLANGGDIKKLQPALREGTYVGSVDGNVLFTVDRNTADKSGLKQDDLTLAWVNNLRSALGAQKLKRTSDMMVSRSLSAEGRPIGRDFDRTKTSNIIGMLLPMRTKDTGKVLLGGASWYGGFFHGRRAADGSRFDMNSMTAAHKSLPFGTIVKVTNLNNKRTCIVKITDRGPYIHGRIIDLSKGAAQQVGMLSSGTAKVKVEVIGKAPGHRRR